MDHQRPGSSLIMSEKPSIHRLLIGLDIGSTTAKAVVVDAATHKLLWSDYRRHETRPFETCLSLLRRIADEAPNAPRETWRVFATGSGAKTVAECIGACIVHEVTAMSRFAERRHPEATTLIEIGGEDAKIVVFGNDAPDAPCRKHASMNDRCAGGTGVIIERIGAKLGISREHLRFLRYDGIRLHRVAGKCGVFAETDVISLYKKGIPARELMASLFDAIVMQNLSVLARGHVLRPKVLLLGGPHAFIPGMRECWRLHLMKHWKECGVTLLQGYESDALVAAPEHAILFAALGAIECGKDLLRGDPDTGMYRGAEALCALVRNARDTVKTSQAHSTHDLSCRATSPEELGRFRALFKPNGRKPKRRAPGSEIDAYLGLDGGSTSTKAVLLDDDDEILARAYQLSQGDPIEDAKQVLAALDEQVRGQGCTARVRAAAVTGYAKDILKEAICADLGLVETVAHMRSASHYYPDADVICDVGGQDIKIIFLGNGVVKDFRVNTQCSGGNGYYLQSTAAAFGYRVEDYAEIAFSAEAMPVFDAGCAVFLQSEIVDVQRQGWRPNEILAGLAAVLPRNIWLNVCQMPNLAQLGKTFVLQGGLQRNLAAVKAQVDFIQSRFEGTGITRRIYVHKHCGESGAIGCALEARLRHATASDHINTSFIGFEAIESIQYTTRRDETTRCGFCPNRCPRTFVDFSTRGNADRFTPRRLIVANCEKGATERLDDARIMEQRIAVARREKPNLASTASRLLFQPVAANRVGDPVPESRSYALPHRRKAVAHRRELVLRRGCLRIGIPRVLNMYSTAPFFMGWFQSLGVPGPNIVWSDYSSEQLYRDGSGRGSIDPCYPSKLAVAHVHNLLDAKHRTESPLTHVFFPVIDSLPTWIEGTVASRSCPASAATPEAAHAAFVKNGNLFEERGIRVKRTFLDLEDPRVCAQQMHDGWADEMGLTIDESHRAVQEGFRALEQYHCEIRAQARAILQRLERENRLGIVVLARPYHMDPGINHGILEQLQERGYPILTVDSLPLDDEVLKPLFGEEADAGHVKSRLTIDDVWKNGYSENSSRKIWAAKFVARHPNLVALELSSFKCGLDAPIAWTLEQILERSETPFFRFRDLDENRPAASISMRVETIVYFLERHLDCITLGTSSSHAAGKRIEDRRML